MLSQPPQSDAHLEAEEVVGYLAGALASAERERIERHLADCTDCTGEIAAVGRLRQPDRAPMRRFAVVAAAAAAVAGIVLLGPGLVQRGPSAPPVRGGETHPSINIVLPADGAMLHNAPDFLWRAVPGAATYRVSVSRANGDSVWATTTRDTSVHAPEDIRRAGAGRFYWYVDVLLDDARSVAGSVREFRIEP